MHAIVPLAGSHRNAHKLVDWGNQAESNSLTYMQIVFLIEPLRPVPSARS